MMAAAVRESFLNKNKYLAEFYLYDVYTKFIPCKILILTILGLYRERFI